MLNAVEDPDPVSVVPEVPVPPVVPEPETPVTALELFDPETEPLKLGLV